jgi:hypothetical protein
MSEVLKDIEPSDSENADEKVAFNSESILEFDTVKKWIDSVNHGKDISEMKEQLNLLVEFCNYVQSNPDELITSCIRTLKDASRAISSKGRKQIESELKDFVQSRNKSGHDAIVEENKIRGFFVHNGIFMQGRAAIF